LKKTILSLLLSFFVFPASVLFAQDRANVCTLNPARLEQVRIAYREGDGQTRDLVKPLLSDANKALKQEPLSVTTKSKVPPSGDKHDFMSMAPYWWPDPNATGGLPYIRRDGEVNPEREGYSDHANFSKVQSAVYTLGLAFYFTRDEKYAQAAEKLISAWFLDTTTKMNPNMNYAQAVRGRNDGRGAGIIETHMLPELLDGIALMQGSKAWSGGKQAAICAWCSSYYQWLTTSKQGLAEQAAPNNHGSWYDVQRASVAYFLGMKDTVIRIIKESRTRRIALEIEPDGRQPKELERTRAKGYSTFNLLALTTLAIIGDNVGVDLWNFSTNDGRSIKKAIDWMLPFYTGEKQWEYKQITAFKTAEAYEVLMRAGAFLRKEYLDAAAKVAPKEREKNRAILLY
jgi:hypothetical protein